MPEATPFQVMIVDDHPLMRRGVRQLLELDSGFEVVAEAGDGASAIDLANRLDIDVILLDLNMKGMSGFGYPQCLAQGWRYRANYYPDRIRCLQRCLCTDRRRRRRLSVERQRPGSVTGSDSCRSERQQSL